MTSTPFFFVFFSLSFLAMAFVFFVRPYVMWDRSKSSRRSCQRQSQNVIGESANGVYHATSPTSRSAAVSPAFFAGIQPLTASRNPRATAGFPSCRSGTVLVSTTRSKRWEKEDYTHLESKVDQLAVFHRDDPHKLVLLDIDLHAGEEIDIENEPQHTLGPHDCGDTA